VLASKVAGELFGLMAQIRFDLKFDSERIAQLAITQLTAEFARHLIIGQVGNVADHTCHAQAACRPHAVLIIVARVKVRVCDNCEPRDFIECDVLGREIRRARDDNGVTMRSGNWIVHESACMAPRLPPIIAAKR
jgi:hypothetical protein